MRPSFYLMSSCVTANEAHAFGEPYNNEKLVRKALRSLPERFVIKIATIEEPRDMKTYKLNELIETLQTFEMNLPEQQRGKDKSVVSGRGYSCW